MIFLPDYEDYHVLTYQSVIPNNSSTSNIIPVPSNLLKLRGGFSNFKTTAQPQQATFLVYSSKIQFS